MTDDVIYSIQCYMMYTNRAILTNLHRRPLKLGRRIVLKETHQRLQKVCSHGNSLFSSPHLLYFNLLVIFSTKKHKLVPQTRANIFIYLLDHIYEAPLANIKMEHQRWPEKPFILGWSGTQYVAMVTKLLSLYCGAHLVESYCKESNISDTNWLRYLSSSYLIKIWLSV